MSGDIDRCDSCGNLPGHRDSISLINRIAGQVTAIGRMIAEDRYCPEILNQIRAARAALRTLESRVLETHIRSCVRDAFVSGDQEKQDSEINEIVRLFSRYDPGDK